jgi:outer membrane protein OmpA-like peptidoglycan-associated protein
MLNRTRAILTCAALLLGACAAAPKPADLIVLVPDRDGKVGTVVVTSAQGVSTLNEAYAAARVEEGGAPMPLKVSEGEVKQIFAGALAARPTRPVSFLLYFVEGSDEYTPESKAVVEGFFSEITRRKAPDVTVIGHTDRVGRIEDNDALSFKRAQRVRADLIQRGVPAEFIGAAGRGEREPIVPTADNVSEPRNRRVEINVR